MKLLQVLGPGCPKCEQLSMNTAEAARQAGIEFRLEKVKDINAITSFGVMMTPALMVDGEVKSMGKILSVEEIKKMLA